MNARELSKLTYRSRDVDEHTLEDVLYKLHETARNGSFRRYFPGYFKEGITEDLEALGYKVEKRKSNKEETEVNWLYEFTAS